VCVCVNVCVPRSKEVLSTKEQGDYWQLYLLKQGNEGKYAYVGAY
jgi:hypothetical protein